MGKIARRGTAIGAAALAGALAFSTAAFAHVDGEPIQIDGDPDVETSVAPWIYRFADQDRVGTALQAYERTDDAHWGDTVIIANSQVFADALAASPLADVIDAPVLLNNPGNSLRSDVLSAASDFDRAIIVGGTDVFGNGVNQQLSDAGLEVDRYHGVNRYQTALALAAAAVDEGEYDEDAINVFLASGQDFPDALAAGAAAAENNGIVLLTMGEDGLDSWTYGALSGVVPGYSGPDFSTHQSIIGVGGPAVDGAAAGWQGEPVETDFDHVGENRYETAIEVAAEYVPDAENFVIASGQDFPDAVVGGAYAANADGALLLTRPQNLTRATGEYLESIRLDVQHVFVFGGPDSVQPHVSQQIADLNWRY